MVHVADVNLLAGCLHLRMAAQAKIFHLGYPPLLPGLIVSDVEVLRTKLKWGDTSTRRRQ